ncbi:hypothetical protein CAP36_04915 [Chitinophagaceae bacterium IBVUCB2]|nr:hypothetical protein CAP36_04915 [Chitinophagaceae bacterium IBVUCB2]
MKTLSLFVISFLAISGLNAQAGHSPNDGHNHGTVVTQAATDDILKLKETEFDFAKIPQGKPVYHTFEIINTGKTALKLDNVSATCGCTTPEWSREEIAPGATAKIKVGYNAAAEGVFEKFITITYNTNQTKQIKIKGTVWKAPEGSAPANASIDLLKKQSF